VILGFIFSTNLSWTSMFFKLRGAHTYFIHAYV
jgi:membrane protein CcdC involved in cytochrome C biogenesis